VKFGADLFRLGLHRAMTSRKRGDPLRERQHHSCPGAPRSNPSPNPFEILRDSRLVTAVFQEEHGVVKRLEDIILGTGRHIDSLALAHPDVRTTARKERERRSNCDGKTDRDHEVRIAELPTRKRPSATEAKVVGGGTGVP